MYLLIYYYMMMNIASEQFFRKKYKIEIVYLYKNKQTMCTCRRNQHPQKPSPVLPPPEKEMLCNSANLLFHLCLEMSIYKIFIIKVCSSTKTMFCEEKPSLPSPVKRTIQNQEPKFQN